MKLTVQSVMDALMKPARSLERTVDGLVFGRAEEEVRGIAVVFMPTQRALEQAAGLGANLVIAHEGAFYSHADQTGSSSAGPVYETKKRLILEAGMSLFRFHDYIHKYEPDLVTEGLVHELGWERFVVKRRPEAAIAELPPASLKAIAEEAKERLGIPYIRTLGDPEQRCAKAAVLVGYRGGGGVTIPLFEEEDVDLVVYGEGPEWETPEYVRDALAQGRKKGVLVLGHAESEAPGMRLLARRLQEAFPQIPVHSLQNEPLFQMM